MTLPCLSQAQSLDSYHYGPFDHWPIKRFSSQVINFAHPQFNHFFFRGHEDVFSNAQANCGWLCFGRFLDEKKSDINKIIMDGYQISFQFQVGLVRDRVVVDSASLNLKSLKSKACDFICEKFPTNGLNRLDERILLFKHDYKSTNILQVSGVNYSTLIEH